VVLTPSGKQIGLSVGGPQIPPKTPIFPLIQLGLPLNPTYIGTKPANMELHS